MVDKADLEELVRLSRELDDLRARRINFLEEELDIVRSEKERLYAANENRIDRIKSLKDERGRLRGQVHLLEGLLESNDIPYREEIDGERDPSIKHNFYVGDHVLVLNGLRAPVSWYKPGNTNGRFIDSEEALHAEVTRVTRDCVYLLNTYKVKFWRFPKHIKRLRRAATRRNHG